MSKAVPGYPYYTSTAWKRLIQSTPSSYTIWKDGTTYRAECNVAGGTDYGDPDASTVIQAAIATGRKLFFKSGTYPAQFNINVPNVTIDGERGALIDASGLSGSPAIIIDTSNVGLRGLRVMGSSDHDAVNILYNSSNILVEGLTILSAGRFGINIYVDDDAQTCHDIKIIGNTISNTTSHGIAVGSDARQGYIRDLTMANNTVSQNGNGAFSCGICLDTIKGGPFTVLGNYVEESWESGIHIEAVEGDVTTESNTCFNNGQNPASVYGAGILVSTTEQCKVKGNTVSNNNHGIFLSGEPAGLGRNTIVNVNGNTISQNVRGIRIIGADSTGQAHYSILSNNINNNTYVPLLFDTELVATIHTDSIDFSQNTLLDNNIAGNDPVYLGYLAYLRDYGVPSMNMNIHENSFVYTSLNAAVTPFRIEGANFKIYNTRVKNISATLIDIAPATPNALAGVGGNDNYVTENSGTGTGDGGQQTIHHLCNFTPTYDQVFLSERSTGGALAYQSAAPDADHIYVTAVNAKTYNWRVSYSP